ncbi:MAG TPA: tRNA pseudouridine(13) synthase TruD [Methanomassiliicoccales archaeon]|nr:tRNA pseudouridine(13) synthase TruD [Methanomassiliicoccales archaeon]
MALESLSSERVVGLELFYTDSKGIGGVLKREPEDFAVAEISRFPEKDENGRYTIATVTTRNWETNRLVRMMAHSLGVSRNRIMFAGTKDKRAVTSQLMAFEAPLEAVNAIALKDISISGAYRSRKHVTIGDLIGNSFEIKVRDCTLQSQELEASLHETSGQLASHGGFANFFGVQRFGSLRPITHVVGRHIVKGDFEAACLAYVGNPVAQESHEARQARAYVTETRDYAGAINMYPKALTFERMIVGYLARNPGDYAGALGVLPPNLQMMFVHAYQSYLFNRALCARIRRGIPLNVPQIGDVVLPIDRDGLPDHDKPVPVTKLNVDLVAMQVGNGRAAVGGTLFGSDSVIAQGEVGELEARILDEEGIRAEDFVVPLLQKCSSRGSHREIVARLKSFSTRVEGADVTFSFALDKGCYATSLLREYTKLDQIDADREMHAAEDERAD